MCLLFVSAGSIVRFQVDKVNGRARKLNNVKKGNIILTVAIVIILIGGAIVLMSFFAINNKGYMPDEGVVPNEETAIKIAETIWFPIYGDGIYSKQPFKAVYNTKEKCWYVSGTLPENTIGGVPEIKINKTDGKIVYINHGK